MTFTPLFSTYGQGENRVTSSMLAVFERVGLALTETISARASGGFTLKTIVFINQYSTGKGAVLDGRIATDLTYLFEAKTVRNAVQDPDQLIGHLRILEEEPGKKTCLCLSLARSAPKP
ncbi:hypothetical protein [Nocardiopsis quinghaiensis]|uniref:hypothetical protein n=1 Tax=Nocardiopsis quinghaiensis TaxID=464995 RepID=UPI0012392A70|nr:hypothetical protein [Nocardiopsis quinghaiensis]